MLCVSFIYYSTTGGEICQLYGKSWLLPDPFGKWWRLFEKAIAFSGGIVYNE
jgi:hypothetical protein